MMRRYNIQAFSETTSGKRTARRRDVNDSEHIHKYRHVMAQVFSESALKKRTARRRDVNGDEHVHRYRHAAAQGQYK